MTFDKEIAFKTSDAEFVSFGHPILRHLLCWVENTLSDALFTGAIFTDPEESLTAISFSTKGGKGRHRVLQVNGFCILYRWKWCNNIFSCRYVGLVRAERNTNPLIPFVKGEHVPFSKGVRGFKQDFRRNYLCRLSQRTHLQFRYYKA